MQRFGFDRFGTPDVFTVVTQEPLQPKPGQVQLQVLGFGLNPYDASLRRGEQQASRPLKFPIIPGTDAVGRVTALGEDVNGLSEGDIVMNYRPLGGYGDYVTASANKVHIKPAALSLTDAAVLPQVGIAAYTILEQLALPDHARLTILGAGGGVGSLLLQLAKYRGLNVTAVAAANHHDQLQGLGADTILDYTQAQQQPGVLADAVVNAIGGGKDLGLSPKLVRPGGTILTTAYVDVTPGDFRHLQLGRLAPTASAFDSLATTARTRGLTIQVAESLPFTLAGVRRGHQLLDAGHVNGKLAVMR